MAVITRGDYVTSPVPNTTAQEILKDGVLDGYEIKAASGYCLHDSTGDWEAMDPETGDMVMKQAFYTGGTSVRLSYAFTPVQVTDPNGNPVTAYGVREFYTLPLSDAPENQVFGGGDNDHVTA